MEERKAEQALENLTVLDLTRVVAGHMQAHCLEIWAQM